MERKDTMKLAIVLPCFLIAACSTAAPPPPDAPPAAQPASQPGSDTGVTWAPGRHHGGMHGKHGGGMGKGQHGGLRHVMHQLALSLMALQSAIEEGNTEVAGLRAQMIADACGEEDPSHHEGPGLGPNFAELDRTLHERAAGLAKLATAGDPNATAAAYSDLVSTCVGCHTQSPRAKDVRLGHLTDAPRLP